MASRRLCQDDDVSSWEPDWMSSLFQGHARARHHVSNDQPTIDTTGASRRKRRIVDVLGKESAENTRNGVGKRACLLDATISREEDVHGVGLNAGKAGHHGNSFSRVYTYDNASVHMGNRYGDGTTINHNYFGLCAAMNLRLTQDIEPAEEAAILRLAAVIIVATIANVIVQPFLLLRKALCRAIPNAVQRHTTPLSSLFGSRMILFEDALGRLERIDTNVINDWTSFHYNLTRSFADQPGRRRVAVAGYRLFHHAQDSQLIDPRRPPPFASVFGWNRHVRMSIHFAWDEVSLECCPKCGLKQTCELEKETTCQAKACGFSYRGHVQDSPIVELDGDEDADMSLKGNLSMSTTKWQRAKSRKRRSRNEQENPAWFSRISVSRQPEETSARNNSEAVADRHSSNILAHDSNTQLVAKDMYLSNPTPFPVHLPDIPSLNTQRHATGEAPNFSSDMDHWSIFSSASPDSPPSPLVAVEPLRRHKARDTLRAGAKRRAQSPIAREKVTNNEQNNPPPWNPYQIFRQWNTAFEPQPNPYPGFGERLTNNPLPTTALLGKKHPWLVEPPSPLSSGVAPVIGYRTDHVSQSNSYTDFDTLTWVDDPSSHSTGYSVRGAVNLDEPATQHRNSLPLPDARLKRKSTFLDGDLEI